MSDKFIKKNIKLSMELDKYLFGDLDRFDQIPNKSTIYITDESDPDFSEASISIARKSRSRHPSIEARKTSHDWAIQPLELKKAKIA